MADLPQGQALLDGIERLRRELEGVALLTEATVR